MYGGSVSIPPAAPSDLSHQAGYQGCSAVLLLLKEYSLHLSVCLLRKKPLSRAREFEVLRSKALGTRYVCREAIFSPKSMRITSSLAARAIYYRPARRSWNGVAKRTWQVGGKL